MKEIARQVDSKKRIPEYDEFRLAAGAPGATLSKEQYFEIIAFSSPPGEARPEWETLLTESLSAENASYVRRKRRLFDIALKQSEVQAYFKDMNTSQQ